MDIVLKGKMDGIEVAAQITSQFDTPIIYLTSYTDHGRIERAKQTKPFGYLLKPLVKKELHTNIEMALHKNSVEKNMKNYFDWLEKCSRGTIDAVAHAIELRGPYTPGHHQRVAEIACAIANKMGLTGFSVEGLSVAAHVYDISFVNIPINILRDSGQLTEHELDLYNTYPQLSYDILKEVDFPWPVADIVLQHRECYDGSGFPNGVKGDNILLRSRILAVAHTIEDLTSHRAFRNALPLNEALEEISSKSGSKYDPRVVDASGELHKALREQEKLFLESKEAFAQIKTLHGILNICSCCKRICNDEGKWEQMEFYIRDRSEADFSHGMCPECLAKYFPILSPR
jgi:response regulator RpfG family c-di-GMP phosphodiesterase